MAVQTENCSPAPPSLRRGSHRFDSLLKARSASTMAAYGKTITRGEFKSVNPHACSLSPSLCCPPQHRRWRGASESTVGASQWSMRAPLEVSHAASLCTSSPRPPTLHLHSHTANALSLPSYYACSSAALLMAPDTVERATDD